MQNKALNNDLKNKSVDGALSEQDLQDILTRYPYFQAARLLYLEKTKTGDITAYKEALQKASIFSSNRKLLFFLSEGKNDPRKKIHFEYSELSDLEQKTGEDRTSQLIDIFLSSQENIEELKSMDIDTLIGGVGIDYSSILESQPESPSENITTRDLNSGVNQEHTDLINSFIEKDASVMLEMNQSEKNYLIADQPEEKNPDVIFGSEDAFLTESLAKIYIKQKRYFKALEIIKKLSLKYPEKNIYFADQIRFLEKLITNIKTE